MTGELFFFWVFSIVLVGSAVAVITARNPVHSVLFLILAFVQAAGLFVLLGAEFLALILIVVYVGAVAVLFLFVVMMLDVDFVQLKQGFVRYLPVGALIAFFVAVELGSVELGWEPSKGALHRRLAGGDRRQYAGARVGALHALRLFRRSGGHDPVHGDDRRDRADAAA